MSIRDVCVLSAYTLFLTIKLRWAGAVLRMSRDCDVAHFFFSFSVLQSLDLWKRHYVWDLPLQPLSSAIFLALQTA